MDKNIENEFLNLKRDERAKFSRLFLGIDIYVLVNHTNKANHILGLFDCLGEVSKALFHFYRGRKNNNEIWEIIEELNKNEGKRVYINGKYNGNVRYDGVTLSLHKTNINSQETLYIF
jgi:hypothetical protein